VRRADTKKEFNPLRSPESTTNLKNTFSTEDTYVTEEGVGPEDDTDGIFKYEGKKKNNDFEPPESKADNYYSAEMPQSSVEDFDSKNLYKSSNDDYSHIIMEVIKEES